MNLGIALKNKENKAHVCARFVVPGRSKRRYVKNYVACRPGSGNGDSSSVATPAINTSLLLLSLLFSARAFILATSKEKTKSEMSLSAVALLQKAIKYA